MFFTSWFEQDPAHIYQTVLTCLKKVGGALQSHDLVRLKGIGITNQRETTILWDRTTGRSLCNAIVWCDNRTEEIEKRLIGTKTKDRLRVHITNHSPSSCHVTAFATPLSL